MDTKKNGHAKVDEHSKMQDLGRASEQSDGEFLTTNQGVRINHTDDSLKAGNRGPTLMEDFHFREKMTHFDHERIPERAVHARGMAAHGYFQPYESMAEFTKAGFLQDPNKVTPVFVRFSTVAGSRGSADTVRDARGFATKFYTEEGNFDLVGNNIPVFFIQDAIKFPDLVHSVKPEPHNEIPQASAAHDTFWDFISLMPESMHMIMWVMSDRGIPRSVAMMEGFGVNTYRFVNAEGKARFVKFHWKPVLGVHSLVWDEAQKLAGKDADFLRRDLWESIEMGDYPEYEFGVQMIDQEDEHNFSFDPLDPTKIWPEEEVPLKIVGKMVLNRNPDNFFAETEQAAFHPGHVVSGIDFSNDPLLQGRLFSYIDTQITRIGSNFAELPINRPVAPVHNNQRDGQMRHTINRGRTSYFPNSLGGGCPAMAPESQGGYVHYAERIDAHKIRERSDSFRDHFSQATMFYNSLSEVEREHVAEALSFELSMVETKAVRERVLGLLVRVDQSLAQKVSEEIGVPVPTSPEPTDSVAPAKPGPKKAPEVSMANTRKDSIKGRRVAILAADGVNSADLQGMKNALKEAGAHPKIVSKYLGTIKGSDGTEIEVDKTLRTGPSVIFDALYIPGGKGSVETLQSLGDALHYVNEAYKHCKAIAASGEGTLLLQAAGIGGLGTAAGETSSDETLSAQGVVTSKDGAGIADLASAFRDAIAQHRHWNRAQKERVPA
jgi:catalase